ncbi:MAG: CPBP family intramembrane metalloprotease [Mollicutes bacterium]|nr:CPBP family intramembrane metalloprotease [Mollicutes bacterium]
MQKKVYNLIKLIILLVIFFNIGKIFSCFFVKLGFDLNTFSYKDTAFADTLIELCLTIIVIIFYYRKFIIDWDAFKKNLKLNWQECLKNFILLFIVKIGASILTSIICLIIGIEFAESDNQKIVELLIHNAPIMMLISSVILAPIVEEGIFRLGFKKVINNKKIFIIVSGLVFGLMHVFPVETSLALAVVQSIIYVSLGITLAYMYKRKNNIYFVIIPHALNNLFGLLAALILV